MSPLTFVQNYLLSIILGVMGALFIFVNYAALIQSLIKKHFVSGVPFIGGILVAIAILLTPYRLWSLLGFLDISIWEMVIALPKIIREEYKVRHASVPDTIEDDKVLFYSKYNKCYEKVTVPVPNREIKKILPVHYYAILQTKDAYALIGCDEEFHVLRREACQSLEEAKSQKTKLMDELHIQWIEKV